MFKEWPFVRKLDEFWMRPLSKIDLPIKTVDYCSDENTKQYFPLVLFVTLHKAFLTF